MTFIYSSSPGTRRYANQDTHSTPHLKVSVEEPVTSLKSFGKHLSSWVSAWLKDKSMETNVFSLLEGIEKLAIMEESSEKM